MKEELISLILETLRGMSEDEDSPYTDVTPDTVLFGKNGILDSIGLVSLIVAVEQAIEDRYAVAVTLADEKAFSQKSSPFRSVLALADYAAQITEAEKQ
jgi:acyl carrier protein